MNCFGGNKNQNQHEKSIRFLTLKVKLLEEEMRAITNEREEESKGYEKDMVVYAFREAEWEQERRRLREEVKRLREVVEEKDEKIREMEVLNGHQVGGDEGKKNGGENGCFDYEVLMVAESRWWRDEAVDKWKKLYLAIKTELDELIQRTHGHTHVVEALSWKAEEDEIIEELKMELKAKEETVEELKHKLKVAEQEAYKKEREIDILRQSLRIISGSSKKTPTLSLIKPKLLLANKII